MIEEVGSIIHFLPPYLIFMPIELAFSKVKTALKMDGIQVDMETALLAAFATIMPQDCQGWISESGLYCYLYHNVYYYEFLVVVNYNMKH